MARGPRPPRLDVTPDRLRQEEEQKRIIGSPRPSAGEGPGVRGAARRWREESTLLRIWPP